MEAASAPADSSAGYPVQLDVEYQDPLNRFLPLVKWLLLIPHYIALFLLYLAAWFALIAAFFMVLFTRRYPPGLFGFFLGVMRWTLRVNAYHYLMSDKYPPFTLEADPGDAATLAIDYPAEGVDRWRPLFAWILAVPYLFVATIIAYLAAVLVFVAFFAILFTRHFPRGMFDIVVVAQRWTFRGYAYAIFMTTKYPPWVWD
jgi:hypothetical protein